MPDFSSAISSIESGGQYGILGPMTKGHRAYGAYQVMDYNIAPWTKEILGVSMTPQQFLSSPQAQDAVFQAKFGQLVQKYGNPQDAASAWFTGRPLAQGGNASDVTGMTGNQYVARFNRALAGGSNGTGPQVSAADANSTQPAPQAQPSPPQQPGGMPAYPWTPQVGGQAQSPQMQAPPMLPALTMPQMRPQVNYQALRQALANLPASVRGYSFLG